jgi:hypothetical protein
MRRRRYLIPGVIIAVLAIPSVVVWGWGNTLTSASPYPRETAANALVKVEDGCWVGWQLVAFGRTWYGYVDMPEQSSIADRRLLDADLPDGGATGTFRQVNSAHGVFTPDRWNLKGYFSTRPPTPDGSLNCPIPPFPSR